MLKKIWQPILVLIILTIFVSCLDIHAIEAGALDQVADKLKATLRDTGMSTQLVNMARGLFFTLALIQLAWSFVQLAADGKTDMQSVVAMLARQMLFIGFFYWWLNNGVTYFNLILTSFQSKGKTMSGVSDISEIFFIGIDTANAMVKKAWEVSNWRSVAPVMFVVGLAAIVTLMSFATVTLIAITTLCKTYIACSVGVYFLGFGANSYTKDIAVNALKVCYVSGVELFVTYLLIGVGKKLFVDFLNMSDLTRESIYSVIFQILIASFVYGGCMKTLPSFISGIVTGASGSAGAGASSIAGGMMAAAGAAVGAAVTGGAMLAGGAIGAAKAGSGARLGGAISGAAGAKQGSIGSMVREKGIEALKGNSQNKNNVSPE